jgi:hypothetical protein
MRKIVLYRISSKGYPKVKVDQLSKFDCLDNLKKTFHEWEFICVADNCDDALLNRLKSDYQFDEFHETKLGNPGSFWKLYEIALAQVKPEDIVYFIEDDYLHLPEAPETIFEGLTYFDYVTVYDQPDKYQAVGKVVNPYAKRNQYSETTQVVRGELAIWRISNSTTMTFAVNGKTLKEDADIWCLTGTQKGDYDFEIFTTITRQPILWRKRYLKFVIRKFKHFFKPKRYLGVTCPGKALHLEMAYISQNDITRFNLPI